MQIYKINLILNYYNSPPPFNFKAGIEYFALDRIMQSLNMMQFHRSKTLYKVITFTKTRTIDRFYSKTSLHHGASQLF